MNKPRSYITIAVIVMFVTCTLGLCWQQCGLQIAITSAVSFLVAIPFLGFVALLCLVVYIVGKVPSRKP
jgi:hypothetical protein